MRSLLLIAAVLVAGALALDGGQVCEPGSNFMVDCNRCRCSSDGKLMSCTRKFCVPESVQGDDPKVEQPVAPSLPAEEASVAKGDEEQVHSNGQVCTPNETKQEDCNRCKCAANGIGWFCTRKACPPREKRHAARPNPLSCTPGTSFKSSDGCNDCFCTETGIAACTMKFCFNDVAKVAKREAPRQANQCEPGTSFKSADGCNDCFCTETGIAACTMKFCFNDKVAKREAPLNHGCAPGTTYKDDCNTCTCGENGAISCTRKFCVPKVKRDVQQQCVPGTTFKDAEGCNDCFCTADGRAACTEKLCLKPQKTKRDAPQLEKQCEPGTSFKSSDGCNNCFCTDNGIAACTMKFCFPSTKTKRQVAIGGAPAKSDCVPGTTFKSADGCNTCYCGENGYAACTQRACLKRKRRDDLPQSKVAPNTEGFECQPNSHFKYQCNQCTCDNTGKFAACTFRLCIEGEY